MTKKLENEIDIRYSLEVDNLFVALCDERSSFGSMNYQDDVIIFKNRDNGRIVGFEILHFKEFGETEIIFGEGKTANFGELFNLLKFNIYRYELNRKSSTVFAELVMKLWGTKKTLESKEETVNHPSEFIPSLEKTLPQKELKELCYSN